MQVQFLCNPQRTQVETNLLASDRSGVCIRVVDSLLNGVLQRRDVPFQSMRRPQLRHHQHELAALSADIQINSTDWIDWMTD